MEDKKVRGGEDSTAQPDAKPGDDSTATGEVGSKPGPAPVESEPATADNPPAP